MRLCYSRMQSGPRSFRARARRWSLRRTSAPSASSAGPAGGGIYDNMKTAVSTVFTGKKRDYNRRFLADVLPPPGRSPWRARQALVGRRVRSRSRWADVRGRLFVPSPRGRSYAEINAWLMDRCIEEAKRQMHPDDPGQDGVAGVRGGAGLPDGLPRPLRRLSTPARSSVSKTCLVRFDNNHYSVAARAVGRPVDVRAYADRIVIRQDGETVGEHSRQLRAWRRPPTIRGITCRSWRGSPARCATARPSRAGSCPTPSAACGPGSRPATTATASSSRYSRRFRRTGLEAVEAACAEALDCGACSADVVLNILARQRQPAPAGGPFRRPRACSFATGRLPTASATTA